MLIKPFLKWAGGKGQLLNKIRPLYPQGLGNQINKYIEPFIGGGAVFFDIISSYKLDKYIINDINKELINTYKAIQQDIHSLLEYLSKITSYYKKLSTEERNLFYYNIRNKYNNILLNSCINVEKAALFIFLNKTCFNGLYRVNRNNQFNVPAGKYKDPAIYDKENLLNISQILQKAEILCGDFATTNNYIDNNTFIYIDPPYRPLTKTSSFTNYSTYIFDDKEQKYFPKLEQIIDIYKQKARIYEQEVDKVKEREIQKYLSKGRTIDQATKFAERVPNIYKKELNEQKNRMNEQRKNQVTEYQKLQEEKPTERLFSEQEIGKNTINRDFLRKEQGLKQIQEDEKILEPNEKSQNEFADD